MAITLVSFVLMIVRRDVASQAIGFFALENGGSLASMVVAAGLPLILEVVFLFDLLVAVVVFGVLIRVHHEQAESLSTETLTEHGGEQVTAVLIALAAVPLLAAVLALLPGRLPAPAASVAASRFYGMWRILELLRVPPGWLAVIVLLVGGFTALLGIAHATV
ncbi:MAG TPA: hypothetical protein VE673_19525 [Pseudonocardiaceae bacterium]|jgi:hypothetical protein|nr:hypothetical protein [Pseudonocardiaceae bacterium]